MLSPTGRWHSFWIASGLFLAAVLVFVLYNFLGTFVSGLFLYYSSRPVYVRLRKRIGSGNLAAATALFILVLPVILLFWYTVTLGLGRLQALAEIDVSMYGELLAPYLEFIGPASDIGTIVETLLSDPGRALQDVRLREFAMTIATAAGEFLGVFLTGLLHMFIALALAFYLLRDDDRIVEWVREHFEDELLVAYGRAVDADLQTVFFGNILNAILTGVIGTIVFLLLARIAPPAVPLPVPILLGLLTGVASLVPVIGMKIVYFPVTLYLVALAALSDPQLLWFPAVFFVVTTVVVDTVPDLVLRPYVSGRNLHIGLVMFAYIFGPLLFGWYGLFLGPLLVVVLSHFATMVVPELTSLRSEVALSTSTIHRTDDSEGETREDTHESD